MQLNAHTLRAWLFGRRLGRPRWLSGQITALSLLARGTLLVVAFVAVVGDQADQEARAMGLLPVQADLPAFLGGHPCMQPAEEEEAAPAPEPEEEPPCPRSRR